MVEDQDNYIFDEIISEEVRIRKIKHDIPYLYLDWHTDETNRLIEVISSEGWLIQFDNKKPRELVNDEKFEIKSTEYHRLLKTVEANNLIVKITLI